MDYIISDTIYHALDTLTTKDTVQKALTFIKEDQEEIIQRQMELTLIPAPTFHEEKKAARFLEMFKEEGLEDCTIDEYGNVLGWYRGKGNGKTILVEGHMDTVFPLDTKLEIKREGGWIRCPGITDDTRGCASVLSVIRALKHAGIVPEGDILFAGTVEEEGMGALGGMKYLVEHHPELTGSISIDGPGFSEITYLATGIQTYEMDFHGIGGHAYGQFGKVANPAHAAGRAIAKISELTVPEEPRTTFEVTGLIGGSFAAIHAIPDTAGFTLNFRSNDPEELEKLRKAIFACCDEACKEETQRWGKDTITWDYKHVCDVGAGLQDPHAPIVEGALAVAEYLGAEEPGLSGSGCTNCSRAVEKGLPAVCLGGGADYDSKCHSLEEQFKEEGAYLGCQSALLLVLLCAGYDTADSIL